MILDRNKLQLLMAKNEMNASDLAKRGNISNSSLCKYIKGTLNPSIKQIGKIANALGVDVQEILKEERKVE
jgi:Predicted transcriptional regulators